MLVRCGAGRGPRGRPRVAVSTMWNLTPCTLASDSRSSQRMAPPARPDESIVSTSKSDVEDHSLPPCPDTPRRAAPPQPNQDEGAPHAAPPQQPKRGAAQPWQGSKAPFIAMLPLIWPSATEQGQRGA
jgi:hypothetical protein